MPTIQDNGAGDQDSTEDLAAATAAGHAEWTGHAVHGLDRSTLYGRLQYSMDDLSYSDYGRLVGLIAGSWIACAGIIFVILFQPHMWSHDYNIDEDNIVLADIFHSAYFAPVFFLFFLSLKYENSRIFY